MSTPNRHVLVTRRHATPFTNASRRKVEESGDTIVELADGSTVNLTKMIAESVATAVGAAVAAAMTGANQPPADVEEVDEHGDTEQMRAHSSGRPPSLFAALDAAHERRKPTTANASDVLHRSAERDAIEYGGIDDSGDSAGVPSLGFGRRR